MSNEFSAEIYEKIADPMEEAYRTDSRPAQTAGGAYSWPKPVIDESVKIPAEEYARRIGLGNVAAPSSVVPQCIMQGKTLQPIEYKVIVKPDLIEETDESIKRFKAMGMELPAAEKEREKQKQITGTLISVGGNAFEDHLGCVPKPGDQVYFAKWTGYVLVADDKIEYRLMNDKDITAVLV